MTRSEQLYQWTTEVSERMPHLSKPQVLGLALWSFGVVAARHCGLSTVALLMAAVWGSSPNTMRQRLREFYQPAARKRGAQRQEVVVTTCVPALVRWALAQYAGPHLALAVDATSLGDRFTVLAVSIVVRGTAIPVHWTVLRATAPHAWRQEWLRMLRQVRPAIPRDWTVVVLADRGLYARWLFRRIVRLGWHPFLRINTATTFRPQGQDAFRRMTDLVPAPGQSWCGQGTAFVTRACRLECTLVARWDGGHADPWLILTDLPPRAAQARWYGLRAWIENGFKLLKGGGWRWDQTRMTDPERVERQWLVLAVATLWVVQVGMTAAADAEAEGAPLTWTDTLGLNVARRGWLTVLATLLRSTPLPHGTFAPTPWPDHPTEPHTAYLPL